MRKIKYICIAKRWFDKVNGNTYHSVRVTRLKDNKVIKGQFQYGYGDDYRDTALRLMMVNNWIPKKYHSKPGFNSTAYLWERKGYPIYWDCQDGLKKDCIANGI